MAEERHQRKRQLKDNQNQRDIISDIPECLLIHILSFLSTKEAVQTCILSKRWIDLWKTLPTLILRCKSKHNGLLSHDEIMDNFVSLRDHSIPIRAISCHSKSSSSKAGLIHRVMEYASSHGIQHLRFKFANIAQLPPLFSSHTLTYLRLSGDSSANISSYPKREKILIFPNSLNLPALTTLRLKYFSFSRCSDDDGCVVDPFSAFSKLNTLIIKRCLVLDNAQNFRISCPNLVNLTLWMCPYYLLRNNFEVIDFEIELYTPTLQTLAYTSDGYINKLSRCMSVLSSIKHATIDVCCYELVEYKLALNNLLVELVNVESLTLSPSAVEVLSGFHDMGELPSLYNLKLLKVETYTPIYTPSVDFLLQNSPSAKVEWFGECFKRRRLTG